MSSLVSLPNELHYMVMGNLSLEDAKSYSKALDNPDFLMHYLCPQVKEMPDKYKLFYEATAIALIQAEINVGFESCKKIKTFISDYFSRRVPLADLSVDHRGQALIYAANLENLGLVQALLPSGNISDSDRGLAVYCAAERGHLEIVQDLLPSGNISDYWRGLAVKGAAGEGHHQILQDLLNDGSIAHQARLEAFKVSILGGHFGIAALIGQDSIFKAARFLAVAPFVGSRAL